MEKQRIVDVLVYVRDHVLVNEHTFAQGNHFLGKDGVPLPVSASSVEKADRSCIEGAILAVLWELKLLSSTENHQSRRCRAVMCALADTLGITGGIYTKVDEVQSYSNREGYAATMLLIQTTVDRLS